MHKHNSSICQRVVYNSCITRSRCITSFPKMLPPKAKIRQKVWKNDSQYFFRGPILFNKFAGNRSTLVQKTLILGKNDHQANLLKLLQWKLDFLFLQLTRKYSTFLLTSAIVKNRFHVIHSNKIISVLSFTGSPEQQCIYCV